MAATLAALAAGRVATLFVADDPDDERSAWYGPHVLCAAAAHHVPDGDGRWRASGRLVDVAAGRLAEGIAGCAGSHRRDDDDARCVQTRCGARDAGRLRAVGIHIGLVFYDDRRNGRSEGGWAPRPPPIRRYRR